MVEDVKKSAFRESRPRSLAKSLTYRIASVAGTGILTWVITRDVTQAISITLILQVFLVILYYSFERIWNRINWGRTAETTCALEATPSASDHPDTSSLQRRGDYDHAVRLNINTQRRVAGDEDYCEFAQYLRKTEPGGKEKPPANPIPART